MLATSMRSSVAASDNRLFVYEVTGLRQNDQTEQNAYPVRNSSSVFIQVPLSRMNQEMRRISRMGGKIVSIRPADAAPAQNAQPSDGE